MSQINVVSIERDNSQRSLPEWKDALSTCVGRVTPSVQHQEVTRCVSTSLENFSGRIEVGELGDIVLAKLAATPNHFSRSLRTMTPTLPAPVLLFLELSGSSRLDQHNRSCTLRPGDWCLIDTLHPFEGCTLGPRSEYLILGLERPSDPEVCGVLEQGVARRWDGKTGLSRVLQSTVTEAFNQLNCLRHASGKSLQRAVTGMAWDALREQLDAPQHLAFQPPVQGPVRGPSPR
jgi:AraC-like protein